MKRNWVSKYLRGLFILSFLITIQLVSVNFISSQTSFNNQLTKEDDFYYHKYDLHVEDDIAYTIDDSSFRIQNITSDYIFAYTGYEQLENMGEGAKLHYYDNIVLVSDLIGNINIISCINLNNPSLILSFTITDFFDKIYEFEMNEDFLYVLIEGYLKVYNMTIMSTPTAVDTYTNASLTFIDLAFNGESLFLLSEELGLSILNITDPTHITQLATYFDPGEYQNIELIGHNAFLTKNKNEIVAVDCYNSSDPQYLSSYNGNWVTNYVGLTQESNNLLVLKNKGFEIIDASNTNNLTKLGEYNNDKDYQFSAIYAHENIAYLASYSNNYYQNVFVIDYTNPETPDQLAPKIRPWYFGNIGYTVIMLLGYFLAPATIFGLGIFFIVRYVRRQRHEFKDIEAVAIKREKKKLHEKEW